MNNKIVVSIIMPVYQAEKWIEHSIQSVLQQTYKDYELILIDDGSTDSSGQICDKMADLFPQIRVFHQKNRGVSGARNAGIDAATGDYILFLDCDDTIDEQTLEKAVYKVVEVGADILFFNYRDKYLDGRIRQIYVELEEGLYRDGDIKRAFMPLFDACIANNIGTKLYKREIIEYVRFDETINIYEDVGFCLAAIRQSRAIYFMNEHFYNYEHKNLSSLLSTYHKEYYKSCHRFFESLYLWGKGDNNFEYWYVIKYMHGMRGAIKNAKREKESFKKVFFEICDDAEMRRAREILKKNRFKGLSFKTRIQFEMMWNKNYYGVCLLWK